MLANGATLSYSTTESGTYTNLPGLKEIPEMGVDPERVENTCLSDTVRKYEQGIGDPGDMKYIFKYDNTEGSSYRLLRALNGAATFFKETLKDGTIYAFKAEPSVKRGGGGVNAALEFTLGLALQSEITITNPQV